jgi:histidinol-phosphate aminotransferase
LKDPPEQASGPLYLDYCEIGVEPIPAAVRRIQEHLHELNRYPRGLYEEARRAVATSHGVDESEVLLTNGVDEAVDLVLLEAKSLTYVKPGFWGYWERAEALDVPNTSVPLSQDWQLPERWHEVGPGAGAFMVAQPNNPTGSYFTETRWLERAVESFSIVMIDETYRLLAQQPAASSLGQRADNLLTFVSFSKAYGLAGVRVGALFGSASLLERLARRKRFHAVDSLSLHAVVGATEDPDAVGKAVEQIKRLRPEYARTLKEYPGLFAEARSTECTFVLGRVQDEVGVPALLGDLASRGVVVTDCSVFGLPGWVRVAVADTRALARLTNALQEAELALRERQQAPARAIS